MFARSVLVFGALVALAWPGTAHAWRHWGWWGPGVIVTVPPPMFYPPPYYGPPPGYYGPPSYAAPQMPSGEACYAGAYVCPLDQPGPQGAPCSCPTNHGRAGGRIG